VRNSTTTPHQSSKPATARRKTSTQNQSAGLGFISDPNRPQGDTDRVPLDEPLFTAIEVGKLLRMSESSVHYLKDQGALPFIRIGNRIRFSKHDLEEYLAGCRCGGKDGHR
jgi:excisionase family DNA binding protein